MIMVELNLENLHLAINYLQAKQTELIEAIISRNKDLKPSMLYSLVLAKDKSLSSTAQSVSGVLKDKEEYALDGSHKPAGQLVKYLCRINTLLEVFKKARDMAPVVQEAINKALTVLEKLVSDNPSLRCHPEFLRNRAQLDDALNYTLPKLRADFFQYTGAKEGEFFAKHFIEPVVTFNNKPAAAKSAAAKSAEAKPAEAKAAEPKAAERDISVGLR